MMGYQEEEEALTKEGRFVFPLSYVYYLCYSNWVF